MILPPPCVKPFTGSSHSQSKFQASDDHSHHIFQLSLQVSFWEPVSLPGTFSSILNWKTNLLKFSESPLSGTNPWDTLKMFYVPPPPTTWLTVGKHRHNHTQGCKFLLILCVFLSPCLPPLHSPWNHKLSRGLELPVFFTIASSEQSDIKKVLN